MCLENQLLPSLRGTRSRVTVDKKVYKKHVVTEPFSCSLKCSFCIRLLRHLKHVTRVKVCVHKKKNIVIVIWKSV